MPTGHPAGVTHIACDRMNDREGFKQHLRQVSTLTPDPNPNPNPNPDPNPDPNLTPTLTLIMLV